MESQDFLPDFFLSIEANRECVNIMKETGEIPTPATSSEIGAIISWLDYSKKESPNFATYLYKDCCFQKLNGKWKLATRNNDYMFVDFIEKRRKNG